LADYNEYASDGTATFNNLAKGEFTLAAEELVAADAAVKAAVGNVAGGALWEARNTANTAWTNAKAAATAKDTALSTALGTASLTTLRAKVVSDTAAWTTQNTALGTANDEVTAAETALATAQGLLDAAVLACQLKAYDAYREALEALMVQRATDLQKIKTLLETEMIKPAPGTKGARCEKALSNGTFRPKRGEMTCAEGLCCGAARVWTTSGTTADSAWLTVETCQTATDTSYSYVPPRKPMQTTASAAESVNFTCIEGAKKLAAAASAVAAAVYMLA